MRIASLGERGAWRDDAQIRVVPPCGLSVVVDQAGRLLRHDELPVKQLDETLRRCLSGWCADLRDEHVVAEVSRFNIYKPGQSELLLHRIRARGASIDDEKFDEGYQQLPAAVWMGWVVPLDKEPALTLIRRLVCSIDLGLDSPTYPVVLCPNWLRELQWRALQAPPY